MAAPYGYPPPPPSSGGGYYPPPPPPSGGGYYPPPPPPSGGGYYPPPPPPSGGGYYQPPTSFSPTGMPPPPHPPQGNFGGMMARVADPKARRERFVKNMFIMDIVISIFSCLAWLIIMALFKWFPDYRLPYALEILLPGGLIFLIPMVLDAVILATNGMKKETMVLVWISETSLKIVAELVLLILYYVLVAPDVSKYLPDYHVGEYGGKQDPRINFYSWMAGLTAMAVIDVGVSIFALVIMVGHLRSFRNPNAGDGGPGGASQPLPPPPGMMG